MPSDLMVAITHVDTILTWQANSTSEEMPPSWMWPFDSELEVHWANVEQARKERFGSHDDDETPMVKNEMVGSRRR